MAISATHYEIFKALSPHLPRGGKVLQIGEANWYGDLDPHCIMKEEWYDGEPIDFKDSFAIAKAFYRCLFAPSVIRSVDMQGTSSMRWDLNQPLPLEGEKFDLVVNNGTAEHIFNVAQVFVSMHIATAVGGIMIHEAPCTGWLDHGFYNLQPTLFFDVAKANDYEIVGVWVEDVMTKTWQEIESWHAEEIGDKMLFVVYRKRNDERFVIPLQGRYNTISKTQTKEAVMLRRSFLAAIACLPLVRPQLGNAAPLSDAEIERRVVKYIMENRLARDFGVSVDHEGIYISVSSRSPDAVNGIARFSKDKRLPDIFEGLAELCRKDAIAVDDDAPLPWCSFGGMKSYHVTGVYPPEGSECEGAKWNHWFSANDIKRGFRVTWPGCGRG